MTKKEQFKTMVVARCKQIGERDLEELLYYADNMLSEKQFDDCIIAMQNIDSFEDIDDVVRILSKKASVQVRPKMLIQPDTEKPMLCLGYGKYLRAYRDLGFHISSSYRRGITREEQCTRLDIALNNLRLHEYSQYKECMEYLYTVSALIPILRYYDKACVWLDSADFKTEFESFMIDTARYLGYHEINDCSIDTVLNSIVSTEEIEYIVSNSVTLGYTKEDIPYANVWCDTSYLCISIGDIMYKLNIPNTVKIIAACELRVYKVCLDILTEFLLSYAGVHATYNIMYPVGQVDETLYHSKYKAENLSELFEYIHNIYVEELSQPTIRDYNIECVHVEDIDNFCIEFKGQNPKYVTYYNGKINTTSPSVTYSDEYYSLDRLPDYLYAIVKVVCEVFFDNNQRREV